LPALGPYSRDIVLAKVDGRSREGRLLKQVRQALTAQLGGKLTPSQKLLVDRAAMLQLRCAALDGRILDNTFTGYDNNSYVAFSNGLRRCLEALGLETPIAPPTQSFNDYIAAKGTTA